MSLKQTKLNIILLSVILQTVQASHVIAQTKLITASTEVSQTRVSEPGPNLAASKIVFISEIGGGRSLYVIDPDHSGINLLGRLHLEEARIVPSTVMLSPDRKRAVFMTVDPRGGSLWVANTDGSDARRLTDSMWRIIRIPFAASWSPQGNRIAFVITRENFSGIYSINTDGSDFHFVAYGDKFSWSPDGQRLAITTFDPRKLGRYVDLIDVDGGNLRHLPGGGRSVECSWSPDGKSIAFVESRAETTPEARYDIYQTDTNGSNKQILAGNIALYSSLVWSSDGRFLSFVSDLLGNRGLYAFSIPGASGARFRFFPGVDGTVAWSPNSENIAYGQDSISIVDLKSQKARILLHTYGYGHPVWLPDGTRLLLSKSSSVMFQSTNSRDVDFYLTDIEPQPIRRLTDDALLVHAISCSPNGKRIAFVASMNPKAGATSSNVYVIDSDGSNLRKLGIRSIQPGWFAWSPDGSKIAFVEELVNCKHCRPADLGIEVANADGSNQHTIVGEAAWNFAPAWLPNGKEIVFLSDRGNTYAVYVTDPNGKATRLVADISQWLPAHLLQWGDPNPFVAIFWSSDATKIALVATNRSMPTTGSPIQIIDLKKPSGRYIMGIRPRILAWSPDNKRITFVDVISAQIITSRPVVTNLVMNSIPPSYIYVADVDGSSRVKLTPDIKRNGFSPNPCASELVWSPDGKRIACEGIMIMNADGSNPIRIVSGHSLAWVQ